MTLFDVPTDPPVRTVSRWQSEHARTVWEVEEEDGQILRLRRIPRGVWVTSPTALRQAKADILHGRWVISERDEVTE